MNQEINRRQFVGSVAGGVVVIQAFSPSSVQYAFAGAAEHLGNDATLEVTFLGTGAADWPLQYPAVGTALQRGSYRGNASLLLDGAVLIDCGPTVPDALTFHGVDPRQLTDLLITHSHGDHLSHDALERLSAARSGCAAIRIRGDAAALERGQPGAGFEVTPLACMEPVEVGSLRVTALPANHVVQDSPETPLHYLIEKDEKRLLYATDGAWLLKPTWLYLRQKPLDAVIWDATIGDFEGDWRIFEHNSLDMIRVMMNTLRKQQVMKPGAQTILTHMARTLWAPHEQVEERLAPENIIPAWDGMRIRV